MIRFLFLTLFAVGCSPTPLTGTPQASDYSPKTFREAVASDSVDVDGLEEIADADIGQVEESYDDFIDDGLIVDDSGNTLSRSGSPCQTAADRGKLIGLQLAAIYSKAGANRKWDDWHEGLAALGYVVQTTEDLDPRNIVHAWRVRYCTVNSNGDPIEGSGLMGVPGVGYDQEVDFTLYAHDTAVYSLDAPSNLDPDVSFGGIPAFLSLVVGYNSTNVRGDIVLLPDYTGFFTSTAPRHEYLQADSEAASMVDLYLAALVALPTFTVDQSDKLFVAGFSQGGHVALAATRALQGANISVAGTFTTGGVFVLEDPVNDYLVPSLDVEPNPYIVDTIVYHVATAFDVGALPGWDIADIFVDPAVYDLYSGDVNYDVIYGSLAGTLPETFTEDFLVDQLLTLDSDFQDWMASNNVIEGWCPDSPVIVDHALDDYVIPRDFADAWVADWTANCPTSDITQTGVEVGEIYDPVTDSMIDQHTQGWLNLLPGLGAQLNAL